MRGTDKHRNTARPAWALVFGLFLATFLSAQKAHGSLDMTEANLSSSGGAIRQRIVRNDGALPAVQPCLPKNRDTFEAHLTERRLADNSLTPGDLLERRESRGAVRVSSGAQTQAAALDSVLDPAAPGLRRAIDRTFLTALEKPVETPKRVADRTFRPAPPIPASPVVARPAAPAPASPVETGLTAQAAPAKQAAPTVQQAGSESTLPVIGELSARFESGPDGAAAVGYDRRGGTSYGKYQLASRVGTMGRFIEFLQDKAPDVAQRLAAAGKANTGSRRGAMPNEWKKIAEENPERFERLQDEFIAANNYGPALQGVLDETKVDLSKLSPAVKEVLWSTAVQHGPNGAIRIFGNALDGLRANDPQYENKLITEVYDQRKRDFGRSSWLVRRAVKARLAKEHDLASDMLEADKTKA